MEVADRFLDHACPDWRMGGGPYQVMHRRTAERILRDSPGVATANLFTSIVCGDLQGVTRLLADRPQAASERGGPKGWPPLLYLCAGRLSLPAFRDHALSIARALLDHGADPNAFYFGGNETIHYTALTCVAGEGEEDAPPHPQRDALFALLLERGAEPYDPQLIYNTSFHGKILWWLTLTHARAIALGREADWKNPDWPMFDQGGYGCGARFLLEIAIKINDVELAQWLLAHGAGPNSPPARDHRRSKRSLHDDAMRRGLADIADVLVRYGATSAGARLEGEDAFAQAVFQLDRMRARALAEAHPACLRSSEAMVFAAAHDRADVVELLLDLGMSPDIEDPRQGNRRPLHVAAYGGSVRVAQLLLDRGAKVDPVDAIHDGTPCWWAMWGRQQATIDLLGRVSRDLWALTASGNVERIRQVLDAEPDLARMTGESTPLFWLPDDEDRAAEIVRLLLSHGADPTFRRKDGRTAADVARGRHMFAAAALLATSVGP